jgi:hypothetical protein
MMMATMSVHTTTTCIMTLAMPMILHHREGNRRRGLERVRGKTIWGGGCGITGSVRRRGEGRMIWWYLREGWD